MGSVKQQCPVCGLESIDIRDDSCPQCNADLTCFRVLDSLAEEIPRDCDEKMGRMMDAVRATELFTKKEIGRVSREVDEIRTHLAVRKRTIAPWVALFSLVATLVVVVIHVFGSFPSKPTRDQ